jgi:ABC-type antimicrobial peptide transport system ATPase subunit
MSEHKCKSCGKLIDSGLIVCPHCQCDPKRSKQIGLPPAEVTQISKQVRKEIGKRVLSWLFILSLISGVGIWQAYSGATKKIEELLVNRISIEFEQPRIRSTVKEVAEGEAKKLMLAEIEPEVTKFKEETQASVEETRELINTAQSQLSNLRGQQKISSHF